MLFENYKKVKTNEAVIKSGSMPKNTFTLSGGLTVTRIGSSIDIERDKGKKFVSINVGMVDELIKALQKLKR